MKFNLLGRNISIEKAVPPLAAVAENRARAKDGLEKLKKCMDGHADLDAQIVDNEQWFRSRHWELMRAKDKKSKDRPEPVTAYLFNILANKHADAMDNYPKPNFLPQERDDETEAKLLSEVVPVILSKNGYHKMYSDSWWYKLKHGFVIRTVLWDSSKLNGLGDIHCAYIDKLNCAWDKGVSDLQKSRNFFIYEEESTVVAQEMYPDMKIDGSKLIQSLKYANNPQPEDSETTLIVDWYYKKYVDGKDLLHFCKLVGENVTYCSENDPEHPEYLTKGYYEHGQFPAVIDVLFPEEGTPVGFGFIAIAKSPQMYIDKMDQLIYENALQSGRARWLRKANGDNPVNMAQFADWSQPFVDVAGSLGEDNLQQIAVKPLPAEISQHRQIKVQELKDITSNDVFNSGNGGKGVTAASAIFALQEAGNKVSRDMISMTYEGSYSVEMVFIIALIRQMYNVTRSFRVDMGNGKYDFRNFDNSGMQPQRYPDTMGMTGQFRVPEFDIKVSAEKSNPYSTLMMNEMATGMFKQGFFNPQMAESADIALEMMSFDGKDKIREMIKKNSVMFQQFQQMQAALVKLAGATGMIQQGAQSGQGQVLS